MNPYLFLKFHNLFNRATYSTDNVSLRQNSTVDEFSVVQKKDNRPVTRSVLSYNQEAVIAAGSFPFLFVKFHNQHRSCRRQPTVAPQDSAMAEVVLLKQLQPLLE